jgi:hypothetical protein
MLLNESIWIGKHLSARKTHEISPLIELGSSTEHFRTVEQPYIDEYIHGPLRKNRVKVIHVDQKSDPGIDISGDLFSSETHEKLKCIGARCILCCNIFEHVTDRKSLAALCDSILSPGGYVFITVPLSFPFHFAPIDTYFRPTPQEISALFPNYAVMNSTVLNEGTLLDEWQRHDWRYMLVAVVKTLCKPFYIHRGFKEWFYKNHRSLWLLSQFKVSVVILQKPPSGRQSLV